MRCRLLAILLVLVAGCTSGRSPQSSMAAPSGTLRVVLNAEPRTLNPDVASDETAYIVAADLFNRLVAVDVDGRLLPDLAASWTLDATEKTYTFHLRRGVVWHDGRPFTADDVKWTMEALRDARGIARQLAARIRSVDVVDPHTVRLNLHEPWAPLLPNLAEFDAVILPRHRLSTRDWREHPENMRPVGTGPFKFERWERGKRLSLVANPSYFKRGPFVERVEYVFVPDPAEAGQAMLDGRADLLATRPATSDLAQLSQSPHLAIARTPSDSRYFGLFNLNRAPFSDRRVRLAASQAVDRQAIVQQALGGLGAPALGFYTPAIGWAYNEDASVPPYSLQRARALLRTAGARGHRTVIFAPKAAPFRSIAIELAKQWRAAGLATEVSLLAPREFLSTVFTPEVDWDVLLLGGSHGPDPDALRLRFATDGLFSFSGFSSPRFDAAVRQAGRKTALLERAAAYREAQVVLADDLPIVPLAESVRVTVRSRRVYGLPQTEARGLVPNHDYSLVRLRE